MLLSTCGAITHENYNQLFPASEQALADQAKHKTLLGYHDLRTGNQPDGRLIAFITQNMPGVAATARARFDQYKDLLSAFASNEMSYREFAARVRRRSRGQHEDDDFPQDPADWEM
jgi:hypothetical protein